MSYEARSMATEITESRCANAEPEAVSVGEEAPQPPQENVLQSGTNFDRLLVTKEDCELFMQDWVDNIWKSDKGVKKDKKSIIKHMRSVYRGTPESVMQLVREYAEQHGLKIQ